MCFISDHEKICKYLFKVFLDEKCDGFFRLPMPERLYCYYDGKGTYDVFVFENLLADSFANFTNENLEEQVRKNNNNFN